jgi:DNA mismatch endonuclease, patch repair protein
VWRNGTPAERAVAAVCSKLGLRYRLNVKSLPGSPDLANKTGRWAIFVHGCFWHRHPGCPKTTTPKRNARFWREKFEVNQKRDAAKVAMLQSAGFKVAVVWECETADPRSLRHRLQRWPKRLS